MGIQEDAELESKFCLQTRTCVLFSEVAVNMKVHDHTSEFSDKHFPPAPEVLLLTVFGNIRSVLSLGIKSVSLCVQSCCPQSLSLVTPC